jgi:hypothetical protein
MTLELATITQTADDASALVRSKASFRDRAAGAVQRPGLPTHPGRASLVLRPLADLKPNGRSQSAHHSPAGRFRGLRTRTPRTVRTRR